MKTIEELNRGCIIDFENGKSWIATFARQTRANHYHKISGHDCILTCGRVEYYERPVGQDVKPTKLVIKALADAVCFSTKPNMEHTMYFPSYSEMVCVRTGVPDTYTQEDYEKELVRFDYSLKDIYDNWKE